MTDSILNATKQLLGIGTDYTPFDPEITMHINSVLSTLQQLGVGPEEGFMVESVNDVWEDFLGDDIRLNNVKTYIYLRVRLLFDPPTVGFVLTAMKQQIEEMEWRLMVATDPPPVPRVVVRVDDPFGEEV